MTKPCSAELTPVHKRGDYFFKREDLYSVGGVSGGKVRTCLFLAQDARGLVTAGSRSSPQVNIVAHIAKHLGIPARAHTPQGKLSAELVDAQTCGCEIVQHRAGYNSVIMARARADATATGLTEIPFGMQCSEAVKQNRRQVHNLPRGIKRIVIPVGSGMSLAGLLWGMKDCGFDAPVLGIRVGADPRKQLDKFAPDDWKDKVKLISSGNNYHSPAKESVFEGIELDAFYEAKCLTFLQPGDLLWIVGVRRTVQSKAK